MEGEEGRVSTLSLLHFGQDTLEAGRKQGYTGSRERGSTFDQEDAGIWMGVKFCPGYKESERKTNHTFTGRRRKTSMTMRSCL